MKSILILSLLLFNLCFYAQNSVTFKVSEIPDSAGMKVGIRGNKAPLRWDTSIELNKQNQTYSVTLAFDKSDSELQYKYVIFENDTVVQWENTSNRTLSLSNSKATFLEEGIWNVEQAIDISTLNSIPPHLLLEDYHLIEALVLEIHPGTYRYNSEKTIKEGLDHLKETFSTALTYQQAYLAVSKMMALLQCDHTKAGFNNQTKLINSIIHYQKDKLPFTFKWIDDDMIIIRNASENPLLERGTKILSINNVNVEEIRDNMIHYIAADGDTDQNRINKMQVHGFDFRYNAFDVFYPLLYPIVNDEITLKIQGPNTDDIEWIKVSTLKREQRSSILASRYPDFPKTRDDMWSFEIQSETTAKLTLNSFGLSGWKAMTIDYKAFLAQAFQQIQEQGISNLIIDIRENTGGNDEMANELFSYLTKDYPVYSREGRTRYQSFAEQLKPHIKTWGNDPWYYELHPANEMNSDGYYIFKENYDQPKPANDKDIFNGRLYLLTSAANTSLAYYTALRFKTQNLGIIIGEETGGNLNGINGGQIIFLTLPNSQIEIDAPIMGEFTVGSSTNSGVVPDIKTVYTREDIIKHRDLELEKALDLIEKN
ncbi:S41 family peptidase [Psychroserpens sp. BH13MA-6]